MRERSFSRIIGLVDITVIVVTYNRLHDLRRALNSIARQTGVEHETIVADNGSTDGTVGMLRAEYPWVRLIEMRENAGMRAHNEAIAASQSDLLFVLDNDMILLDDTVLATARDALTGNSRLGAAACRVYDLVRSADAISLKLSGNCPKHVQEGDPAAGFETSAFDGGATAFRRSAIVDAGLFCQEFFLYHGEVDLTTRLLSRGWGVRYFPEMSVIHCHSPVQRSSSLYSYLATRNYFWYVRRNYPRGERLSEIMLYLRLSAVAVAGGHRRAIPWIRGVLRGLLGAVPACRPATMEVIRRQQEIRVADRVRKERTGEMKEIRRLSDLDIERLGLRPEARPPAIHSE